MVEPFPRHKDYNTIRQSYHVRDEGVLRYMPYLGEKDDIDLGRLYKLEIHTVQMVETLERKSLPEVRFVT
jgi:hypothetical protein